MDFLRKAGNLQWTLAGLLLGSGFLFPLLWPLGLVGLGYFIYLAQQPQSYRQLLLGGFLAWTVKALAALQFFLTVYPIDWLAIELRSVQLVLVSFYWITNALWVAVGGAVAAVLIGFLSRRLSHQGVLLAAIAGAWLLAELVGSFSFSLMTYGPGGAITSAFSFGYIGYLAAYHDWFAQLARFAGVYGLSLGAVLLTAGYLQLYPRLLRMHRWAPVVIVCLFWASSFVPFVPSATATTASFSVLSIDTTFPNDQVRAVGESAERQAGLETAIETALSLNPDYILLPEGARYFSQSLPVSQVQSQFQFLHANPQTIIVDTDSTQVGEQKVLQAFVYNGKENTVDQSHKRYLVPQGEFMPYFYATVVRLLGYGEAVDTIEQDLSYQVGPQTDQSAAAASTPGVLYCFESVSPWGVRAIMKERGSVPFIAHPVSHSWFHEPIVLWQNLNSMLRVQAIWNQTYIVSAGSQVAAQVFTPAGDILTPEVIAEGADWKIRQSFIPRD